MPIKIQSDLPVKEILEKENIFVMDESRVSPQTFSLRAKHCCRINVYRRWVVLLSW